MLNFIKRLYIWSTGYSYTNLGRLFLRLFVGLMLMQFGVRQMYQYGSIAHEFPTFMGMSPEATLVVMIVIEILFQRKNLKYLYIYYA